MNKNLSAKNLETVAAKKLDRLSQQTTPIPPETQGFYVAWDAVRNLHKVQLPSGDMVWGSIISTGSVGAGDVLTVQRDEGSAIAAFKVTPR